MKSRTCFLAIIFEKSLGVFGEDTPKEIRLFPSIDEVADCDLNLYLYSRKEGNPPLKSMYVKFIWKIRICLDGNGHLPRSYPVIIKNEIEPLEKLVQKSIGLKFQIETQNEFRRDIHFYEIEYSNRRKRKPRPNAPIGYENPEEDAVMVADAPAMPQDIQENVPVIKKAKFDDAVMAADAPAMPQDIQAKILVDKIKYNKSKYEPMNYKPINYKPIMSQDIDIQVSTNEDAPNIKEDAPVMPSKKAKFAVDKPKSKSIKYGVIKDGVVHDVVPGKEIKISFGEGIKFPPLDVYSKLKQEINQEIDQEIIKEISQEIDDEEKEMFKKINETNEEIEKENKNNIKEVE